MGRERCALGKEEGGERERVGREEGLIRMIR